MTYGRFRRPVQGRWWRTSLSRRCYVLRNARAIRYDMVSWPAA